MATNGNFTSQWGAGTLTATHSGLNVFSLTGAQFNSLYQLNFVGQAGDVAIVNILGSVNDYLNFNLGNFDVGSVLFNFVDATSVASGGIDWKGSILAPKALVSLEGGTVRGSVVSAGFSAAGASVQGNAFTGVPAPVAPPISAVPEPATWATMIAGFGLVGFALRSRRRLPVVAA
ncbi:choice-of-anchor A family protein [Sphingomonas sp. XMGL2]|uniref:Choice-of-anchor A family protein n=2 Tax=Sphingomonas quercus TaxID=2842451 RepID=A0ABS6BM36_9SPHN|nr:choice-of-anchor A family protein [Sphingomonas quercus]